MNVEPGTPSYAEMLARVAALLDADQVEHEKIAQMSRESAREWFDDFVKRTAAKLGIALSDIAAAVADLLQIARNAGAEFKRSYHANYEHARKIRPS